MQREQKVQVEKIKRIKKKMHVLHYLLVYLVCLFAACVVWLLVRYSMRIDAEDRSADSGASKSTVSLSEADGENTLYV